jgi:hypothetical protein
MGVPAISVTPASCSADAQYYLRTTDADSDRCPDRICRAAFHPAAKRARHPADGHPFQAVARYVQNRAADPTTTITDAR